MMRHIMMMVIGGLLIASCAKEDDQVRVNPAAMVAPVWVNLPTEAQVLQEVNAEMQTEPIQWSAAEFGYPASITYTIQARKAGTQSWNNLGSAAGETRWSTKTSLLNNALIKMGCSIEAPNQVEWQVVASIAAAYDSIKSPIEQMLLQPYNSEVEYPSLWVIGDYCGWDFATAERLYSTADNGVYAGWIDLNNANGFKFTSRPDWDTGINYGGTMEHLESDPAAGNITLPAPGYYRFEVNTRTLVAQTKYAVQSLGLIGDAAPLGWDAQSNLTYDRSTKTWRAVLSMSPGKFKVRINDNWDLAMGEGSREGLLGTGGDIAFTLSAGNYEVVIDLSRAETTYDFIKK